MGKYWVAKMKRYHHPSTNKYMNNIIIAYLIIGAMTVAFYIYAVNHKEQS